MLALTAMSLLGASPAPDLSAFLAPVSSDWIEFSPSLNILEGPFNSHQYAVYVSDPGTEDALNHQGFVAGYARAWEQKGTQDYLAERVFEFESSDGATSAVDGFKVDAQTSKKYKHELTALPHADSFGAELDFGTTRSFRYWFARGNLLLVVHLDTDSGNDLSGTALSIAQTEYDMAPNSVPVAATQPGPMPSSVIVLAVIFLAASAVGAMALIVRSRRRPAYAPASATSLQLSPDGAYWWDGVRWRDAVNDIPPGAQRSPDGLYWWDGSTWRRVGSA